MPKKSRKRLTQRKGTSVSGQSTRSAKSPVIISDDKFSGQSTISAKSSVSICDNKVSPGKRVKATGQLPITDGSHCTSLHSEQFTMPHLPAKKIKILENILLIPARQPESISPILRKDKKRISYYSVPIINETEEYRPYIAPKVKSYTQDVVKLIVDNKFKASDILEELSMNDSKNRSLIFRMVEIFPSTKADRLEAGPSLTNIQLPQEIIETIISRHPSNESNVLQPAIHMNVNVMVHHTVTSQIDNRQRNTPKHPVAANLLSQHFDSITIDTPEVAVVQPRPRRTDPEFDQILIDVENEARQTEQARIRATLQEQWRQIADFQHQITWLYRPMSQPPSVPTLLMVN